MKSKPVEFSAPAGVVPEGTEANEEFDAVATFRVKESGTICLVKIGEVDMPVYKDKGERPSYHKQAAEMADSYPKEESGAAYT